jgi:DnaJ-class molecular chaperone
MNDRYSSYSPDALEYIQDALIQDCPDCHGSGVEDDGEAPCVYCFGEGYI